MRGIKKNTNQLIESKDRKNIFIADLFFMKNKRKYFNGYYLDEINGEDDR